jgi:hypothetical protein
MVAAKSWDADGLRSALVVVLVYNDFLFCVPSIVEDKAESKLGGKSAPAAGEVNGEEGDPEARFAAAADAEEAIEDFGVSEVLRSRLYVLWSGFPNWSNCRSSVISLLCFCRKACRADLGVELLDSEEGEGRGSSADILRGHLWSSKREY